MCWVVSPHFLSSLTHAKHWNIQATWYARSHNSRLWVPNRKHSDDWSPVLFLKKGASGLDRKETQFQYSMLKARCGWALGDPKPEETRSLTENEGPNTLRKGKMTQHELMLIMIIIHPLWHKSKKFFMGGLVKWLNWDNFSKEGTSADE